MAGRRGLYEELVQCGLLDKARTIVLGDGSDTEKADHVAVLLAGAGSGYEVTSKRVFGFRHKIQNIPAEAVESVTPPAAHSGTRNGGSPKKSQHPHDGRKQNRPPAGPKTTSFTPGNTAAVTTGEYVNPWLRELFPERDARQIQSQHPDGEIAALEKSIQLYDGRLHLQLRRLRALEEMKKAGVYYESSHTRQEGDGELMGTGRISTLKKRSLDEEIRRQHQLVDRTQAKYDAAVKLWHTMLKGSDPDDPQAGLKALAAAIESSKQRVASQKAGGAT